MEQFGDELIIQSFKIPWLIWIHLLVTVLLVILLFFGFTVFTSDDSISPSSSTAASPSTYSAAAVPAHLTKPSSSNRKSKIIDQCCKKYRLRPPRRAHHWVATSLGVRCCRHSFHLQKSSCLACACPGTRKRTYNWSVIRLKTTGSGHMRYLHHVHADSRPTLEKVLKQHGGRRLQLLLLESHNFQGSGFLKVKEDVNFGNFSLQMNCCFLIIDAQLDY